MRRRVAPACAALALVLQPVSAGAAPAPAPVRDLVQVKDGVWRSRNGGAWGLVYVTDAGILLADPTSTDFAVWLKAELARRFPGKPVRYVVYSHSHFDHAEGAAAFPEALVVAQEGVLRNMDGRFPHMPGGMIDLNQDGAFELDEVRDRPTHPEYSGVCGSNFFARMDADHDGKVTPKEYHAEIRRPDVTYSERMTLTLGGKTIELIYPGKNHADDGTVVYLPAERTVFSSDFPADALVRDSMRSLPSACGNFDSHPLSDWIKSYRSIEALDFDTLLQSHGTAVFHKADVIEGRRFFEDLTAAVSAGMAQGKTLAELKQTITLDAYKGWSQYPRLLGDDIEAAYRNLQIYR